MRSSDTPSRSAGIAATATTLVAILAMATTSSIIPATAAIPLEARSLQGEAPAVRAVAAVVAAMARDLIDLDVVVMTAMSGDGPEPFAQDAALAMPMPASTRLVAPRRLGPRLLDLPPPAC